MLGKRGIFSRNNAHKNNGRAMMMQSLHNNTNPSELSGGFECISCCKSAGSGCSGPTSAGSLPPRRGSNRKPDGLHRSARRDAGHVRLHLAPGGCLNARSDVWETLTLALLIKSCHGDILHNDCLAGEAPINDRCIELIKQFRSNRMHF